MYIFIGIFTFDIINKHVWNNFSFFTSKHLMHLNDLQNHHLPFILLQ
jgi:hypothetical protein